jgi:hypothetical protein
VSAHELVLVRLHRSGTSEWQCRTCPHHEIRLIGLVWVRVQGDDVPHEVRADPLRRLGPAYCPQEEKPGQQN